MPSVRPILALAFCVAVLPGCSEDSTTAPASPVTFLCLPAAVLTAYCVQGQKLTGQAISGTLGTTDCDAADVKAVSTAQYNADRVYYAVWRVRVATTGTYQFAAFSDDPASPFDNVLNIYHLGSYTAATATLTGAGYHDDSGGGPNGTNAQLSVSLTAGQDYFMRVAGWADGFDGTGQGTYTSMFTGP